MSRYASMFKISLVSLAGFLVGCTGVHTFPTGARPGETIAVAIGYKQQLNRGNINIKIIPEAGSPYIYSAGDARIRTVFQAYPDPVSKLMVANRAHTTYGTLFPDYTIDTWGDFVEGLTGGDNDWSQTFVLFDLPTDIATGSASLQFTSGGVQQTQIVEPIRIQVLPGPPASTQPFQFFNGTLATQTPYTGAERASHFVVNFTGPQGTIPHSIEAVFSRTLGAAGDPWVTHGRGDLKNLMWSDNGSELKVMLMPVKGQPLGSLKGFKFYVTGSVATLSLVSLKAYDASGNSLSGFLPVIEHVD